MSGLITLSLDYRDCVYQGHITYVGFYEFFY